MARVKKKLKARKADTSKVAAHIEEQHADKKLQEEYLAYAVAMIEDRFVIGNLDGLKPVMRRSLFAIHKLGLTSRVKHDKSAKAVGATIADYHPHGDTACYEAMVTAANCAMPMIDGKGNWGSMMDREGFAAYRYTNLRLTKYGEHAFFDKFYLPAMEDIPNYDGSKVEPLNLPCLLPNALLNGNFGMGPGVNTRTMAFTLRSVVKTIKAALKEKGATPENCMGLVPTSEYGGFVDVTDKAVRKDLRTFYRTGVGSIKFWSTGSAPDKNNAVRYARFAPLPKELEKTFTKIKAIKGVLRIEDDSESNDPYKAAIKVTFAKNLNGKELKKVIRLVDNALAVEQRFDVKVTDRVSDGQGGCKIALRSSNVPTLLNDWIGYRVKLEKLACSYWKGKRQERIVYLQLMLKAIAHLDIIFKALKRDDTEAYMVKHMKITSEEADTILSLTVRRLKKLEVKVIHDEIADLRKEIAGYDERIKKPRSYIFKHLDSVYAGIKDEAARQELVKE